MSRYVKIDVIITCTRLYKVCPLFFLVRTNMSCTRWCFTINNPGDYIVPFDPVQMEYLVWQRERGEAAGTEHIQGYVRLKKKSRMSAVKLLLGRDDPHLEMAKGSEEQNRQYCTKEETRIAGPFEHGTYKAEAGRQGARTDVTALKSLIKTGATRATIAEAHPDLLLRYPSGVAALQEALLPPAPAEREIWVHVLWGDTGTGKTHRVRKSYPNAYIVRPGRDPWGQYSRQDVIIFEEFSPLDWKVTEMNTYLDKWPCQLDARYTNKEAHWTKVFILSNLDPSGWYTLEPESQRLAFQRRLSQQTRVRSQEQDVQLVPLAMALPTGAAAGTSGASSPGAAPAAPIPVAGQTQVLDEDDPIPLKRLRRANARVIVLSDDEEENK